MTQTIRSPFPGVDPYLESQNCWRDFHSEFIHCWRETLLQKLPPQYSARVNEDVYIGKLSGADTKRFIVPDVAVVRTRRGPTAAEGGVAMLVEEEVSLKPTVIPHAVIEERRLRFIEIRKEPDELVAVLEVLSPTNKSWGKKKYWKKRQALRKARVHIVEVDMLIDGASPPLALDLPEAHCHVLLTRGETPAECEVYSWNLPEPLPIVPVPLAPPDLDLTSNLQTVFNLAFERGQYPRVIDYTQPLELPLDAQTREWASGVAKKLVAGK